ncbi:cuticle protein 76-like [Ischnura elegans]|uniref:cuticle protein 76-like n=1 Tax=Ischnura elegans TaxID=197161 RepID=UPI001ED87173|nr:cuticle protein 76-like [Ischnura elegans]
MAFKYVILAAVLAVANAGYLGAPAAVAYHGAAYAAPVAYGHPSVAVATPAITSQHQNTLRSYGNLGQVSTYSKTIDTPFSSVRKSDVRVSNDALAYAPAAVHAAPVAYHGAYAAAPAYRAAYAAPAVAAHGGLLGVAYSAAPAVAHMAFNGYGINYAY